MDTIRLLREQLTETYEGLISATVAAAPKVITGIILVLLAWLIAKVVQRVLRSLLIRIKFDTLVGKVGIDKALGQLGLRQAMSEVLPRVAYYLLLFLFARTLADTLGLQPVSDAIGSFLGYVPNLVAALLILLIGSAVGQFAGMAVTRTSEASGLEFGTALARVVSGLIFFIAAIMAVGQLKIDTDIVRIVTLCGLSGIALAFGLSFGLGTREISRSILAGFYARQVLEVGSEVEIEGERGRLVAITPTLTILEHDGDKVIFSNTTVLDAVSRLKPNATDT